MILGIRDCRQRKNGDDNKLHMPQLHNASRSLCGNYTTRKPQWDHSCPGTGDYGFDHSCPLEKQVPDELIQFAGLAGIIAVGVGFIYLISRVRRMYEAQHSAFSKGTATAQKIQNLETEFISLLQRVESDSAALQKIAMQIESSVASLNDGVTASLQGASSRYGSAIEELRDHVDLQEERLLKLMEHISEAVDTLPQEGNLKVQPANLAYGTGNRPPVMSACGEKLSAAIPSRGSRSCRSGWRRISSPSCTVPRKVWRGRPILSPISHVISKRKAKSPPTGRCLSKRADIRKSLRFR